MPEGLEQHRIVVRPIEDEMRKSYVDYAMSVIVGRALPDVRDGLKPVHRRILFAMNELGMNAGGQFRKCARVVGECFIKGTLVATERGLIPIEDVVRGERVFTENGMGQVRELYVMPSRPVLRVRLKNGMASTATRSQKFRVVSPDSTFSWKKGSDLRPGDWLVLRSVPSIFPRQLPRLPKFEDREMRLSADLAYLLGALLSDGWVSHEGGRVRLGFYSSDRVVMERVLDILQTEFGYRPVIEVKRPSNPKRKTGYSVRVSRDAINNYFVDTFKLRGARAENKRIPYQVMRAPRLVIMAFLSGLIDGDGHIAARRRVIQYGTVSEGLADDLQVLLHHLGFGTKREVSEPVRNAPRILDGRPLRSNWRFHSLEVRGNTCSRLAEELNLTCPAKKRRASTIPEPRRPMQEDSDVIPNGSSMVFGELSQAHLGSGWYGDTEGLRFRQGIRHPGGSKIRYASNLSTRALHFSQLHQWGLLEKLHRIGSPLGARLDALDDSRIRFAEVAEVTVAGREPTYDVQVEGEHNFVANGMVVHNCLGKFHPHGEMAVYDALVRMGQDFSMRSELVDGQGNFGSVDGDPPAAMRYTECRLTKVSEEMLADLEKDTVNLVDNFDATLKEPTVLPAKFPNLLVNGSTGIAVGMATNIPPHNLGEVVDALVHLIDHPDARLEDLLHPVNGPIRGPDFPTGGIVYGFPGVIEAYSTGRGLIQVRAKHALEEHNGRKRVIVTEIPYLVNKSTLLETIAGLVRDKRIDGVSDLRDESDRDGMRIVIELKKDALEDAIVNQLFTHTQLQETFSIINIALVNGEPKTLGLVDLLRHHVSYREEVVRRRTQFDLNKARARLHIVEGLITAVDHIDEVITLIRRSREVEQARQGLMVRYLLSEEQAKAILELRLSKLTSLGIQELRDEQAQLNHAIEELTAILGSRDRVLAIIKSELLEIKEKYADERRTQIVAEAVDLEVEDLIPLEDCVVSITNTGYAKRVAVNEYRLQGRGGKGTIGMETKEEDYVTDLFIASTHDYLMFFTSAGRCFWLKCYRIPPGTRYSKGKPLVNLLPRLEPGEKVQARISVREFDDRRSIIFATKQGTVKRTNLNAYSNVSVRGINAIHLREGDELVAARLVEGTEEILLASRAGLVNRFSVEEAREIGRVATGVIGMRLREGDEVVSMAVAKDPKVQLLTLLESGFGKRTVVEEYRQTRRGSQGVKTTDTKRGATVVAVRVVNGRDELLVTTVNGKVIRCPVSEISQQGRSARGVRIIRLDAGDSVAAVARLVGEQEGETMASQVKSPDIPPPSPYPGPGPSRPAPGPHPEPDDDE